MTKTLASTGVLPPTEYTCGKLAAAVDPKDRRERINTLRTLGALSTVGFSFVIAVLLGLGAGYGLDRLFKFEKYPVFFLIFGLLGTIAGMLNVFRASNKLK